MDNFAEQLVVRNETAGDKTKRIATTVTGSLFTACLVLLAILQMGTPLVAFLGLALAAAAGYSTFYLTHNSYVEYEYTFTNGELEVDKIINKSKRKSLVTVDVRSFTDFGKYDDEMEESEDMTVVFATNNVIENEFYAEFEDKNYGSTRLVFVPNENVLRNMKKFLPAKLRSNIPYTDTAAD